VLAGTKPGRGKKKTFSATGGVGQTGTGAIEAHGGRGGGLEETNKTFIKHKPQKGGGKHDPTSYDRGGFAVEEKRVGTRSPFKDGETGGEPTYKGGKFPRVVALQGDRGGDNTKRERGGLLKTRRSREIRAVSLTTKTTVQNLSEKKEGGGLNTKVQKKPHGDGGGVGGDQAPKKTGVSQTAR